MAIGYGVDTYCADSLQTGRLVGGRLKLGLDCYRMLRTPQGTLPKISDDDEDANYGRDLAQFIGKVDSRDLQGAIGPFVRGGLMSDERVRDVSTSVLRSVTTEGLATYTLEVRVLPVDEDTELALTLEVSSVTVKLLGVS